MCGITSGYSLTKKRTTHSQRQRQPNFNKKTTNWTNQRRRHETCCTFMGTCVSPYYIICCANWRYVNLLFFFFSNLPTTESCLKSFNYPKNVHILHKHHLHFFRLFYISFFSIIFFFWFFGRIAYTVITFWDNKNICTYSYLHHA